MTIASLCVCVCFYGHVTHTLTNRLTHRAIILYFTIIQSCWKINAILKLVFALLNNLADKQNIAEQAEDTQSKTVYSMSVIYICKQVYHVIIFHITLSWCRKAHTARFEPVFDPVFETHDFTLKPDQIFRFANHCLSYSVRGERRSISCSRLILDDQMNFWQVRNFGQQSPGSHIFEAEPRVDSLRSKALFSHCVCVKWQTESKTWLINKMYNNSKM